MLPPRPLLAACILMVAGLAWSTAARPVPHVGVADAARWEGQTVAVEGWAADLTNGAFTLRDGAAALPVRFAGTLDSGDRVQATGLLSRWQGTLRLDATALEVVPGPHATARSWSEVAAHPERWQGTPLTLAGEVKAGRFGEGTSSVATGTGPWPASGRVAATGLLRDDPACLCWRLDAREVRPSTP